MLFGDGHVIFYKFPPTITSMYSVPGGHELYLVVNRNVAGYLDLGSEPVHGKNVILKDSRDAGFVVRAYLRVPTAGRQQLYRD